YGERGCQGILPRVLRIRPQTQHARCKTLQEAQEVAVMTVLLQVDDLIKKFGGVTAVNNVSFPVLKGEIFSLIGPNGAGKTTMFNMISRVLPVTSGTITLDGKDITREAPHKIAALGMGRTFQNLA